LAAHTRTFARAGPQPPRRLAAAGQTAGRTVRERTSTGNPRAPSACYTFGVRSRIQHPHPRPGRPRATASLLPAAFACVAALATAGLTLAAPAPRPAIKPQPPLEVKLEALDALQPGHAVRSRLIATPRLPVEEIRVTALPAPEVAWLAGRRAERRAARRDEPGEFRFTVRVPRDGRHPLYLRVEITAADGTVWQRGVGLGLGPDPRAERARVVPDGRGGEAIEYDAAPAAAGAGR
jgi:hypothetical protein